MNNEKPEFAINNNNIVNGPNYKMVPVLTSSTVLNGGYGSLLQSDPEDAPKYYWLVTSSKKKILLAVKDVGKNGARLYQINHEDELFNPIFNQLQEESSSSVAFPTINVDTSKNPSREYTVETRRGRKISFVVKGNTVYSIIKPRPSIVFRHGSSSEEFNANDYIMPKSPSESSVLIKLYRDRNKGITKTPKLNTTPVSDDSVNKMLNEIIKQIIKHNTHTIDSKTEKELPENLEYSFFDSIEVEETNNLSGTNAKYIIKCLFDNTNDE